MKTLTEILEPDGSPFHHSKRVHSEMSEIHIPTKIPPRLPAFDYASISRPAGEAPGSFLETESLPVGEVVFAIGDAGAVPDPLPLLCVRHYFHRSLSSESACPALVAEKINGLIYDCCGDNCLTCFYACYTRETGVLRYVNAGHDAPILIRRNPDEVLRLEKGGPVFGLQELPRYREGVVHLKPGDRLVAFTQGVIDSLAAHNSRSPESVLIALVRNCASDNAAQLANLIVAECEGSPFCALVDRSVIVASVGDDRPLTYGDATAHAADGYVADEYAMDLAVA